MIGDDKIGMLGWSTTSFLGNTFDNSITEDTLSDMNQRVGYFNVRVGSRNSGNIYGIYYNDNSDFPTFGCGSDSYRTAGVGIKFNSRFFNNENIDRFSIGIKLDLITGYVNNKDRSLDNVNYGEKFGPHGTYKLKGSHKNLSSGLLYADFGIESNQNIMNIKLGIDSEEIRNYVQNTKVHDKMKIPRVPVQNKENSFYWNLKSNFMNIGR